MNFIKKQGIGAWISLAAIVLSIIGFILYNVALSSGMGLEIASGSQLFYEAGRAEDAAMMTMVVTCGVIALVLFVASIVLDQFRGESVVGKVCSIAADACRIVAPALLIVTTLYFVYGSFTGLGWTFFSNEELVIFETAIATGKTVITGIVFFLLAAIAGIVGAYFEVSKKD